MMQLTWNTNREQLFPGRYQSDVRGKWINWLDTDGWKSISPTFVDDSGAFRAAQIPGVFQAPANSNQPVTLSVEQRYNVFSKSTISDAPLVIEATPENVRNVSGQLSPDLSSIVYPDAWADGVDLRYRVDQRRGPRVSREVVINSMPLGTGDLEFSWLLSSDGMQLYKGKAKAWKGRVSDRSFIHGQGMEIRAGKNRNKESIERGSGIRKPTAWYFSNGERIETDIRVDFTLVSRDVIRATKVIPRLLVVAALAAGSPLYTDDTSTFYPDPSVEVSSVDGYVYRIATGENWATKTGATTGTGFSDTSTVLNTYLRTLSATNEWHTLYRTVILFDTSAMDDAATISSADLQVTSNGSSIVDYGLSIAIVGSTPASDTTLANADYDQFGTTRLVDTDIPVATWEVPGDIVNTLNASGLAAIDVTDVSKFALDIDAVVDDTEPTWQSGKRDIGSFKSAEVLGTTTDPRLIVNYTLSTVAMPVFAHHYGQLRK